MRSECAPRRASLVKISVAKMPLLWINIKCHCPKFQLHLFKLNEDHSFTEVERNHPVFFPFYAYIILKKHPFSVLSLIAMNLWR